MQDIELFLMDMDGTVYMGPHKIPGAFEALDAIRRSGRKICFVTNNSSRSIDEYLLHLKKYGFEARRNEMFSSTIATCEYLKKHHEGALVYALATDPVREEMRAEGICVMQDGEDTQPDIVVVAFDTTLTYQKLYTACQYIHQGAVYIATHPDNFCPSPVCPMPDLGGFIAIIDKTINRTPDVIIGKPYAPMAEAVSARFGIPPEHIAMVGDRLYTDIRFGVENGMNGILVLTGETTSEMLEKSDIRPTLTLATFADILPLLGL